MSTPKRIITGFLLSFLLATLTVTPLASAQNTILPYIDPIYEKTHPCDPSDPNWQTNYGIYFQDQAQFKEDFSSPLPGAKSELNSIIACAIKTGHIRFFMIPYLMSNIINFIIGLAALISILMIMVGAYFYIAGGLTDDKEKGKTIIKYALGGLVMTILSWTLVNFVLLILTA